MIGGFVGGIAFLAIGVGVFKAKGGSTSKGHSSLTEGSPVPIERSEPPLVEVQIDETPQDVIV
jgi:hypothetical protein